MKIIKCEQNSPAWYAARIGRATASNFHRIISPTGEKSRQWEVYAHEILAEEIVGHSIEGYQSADMAEGNRREEESVSYYELIKKIDTQRVGFITTDDGSFGCSPDRLVGDDGMLEMKNPKHGTFVGYLLGLNGPKDYWPQIQGGLLISERKWTDFMPYFPEMPELIIRVERDEPYIASMYTMLSDFNNKLAKKRQQLIASGYLKQRCE